MSMNQAAFEKVSMDHIDAMWGQLGTPVNNHMSVQELLDAADLDWNVEIRPVYANLTDLPDEIAPKTIIPGNNIITRTDNYRVLSTFAGKRYKIIQNVDAINTFKDFCDVGGLEMTHIGNSFGGRYVWAMARLPENFRLANGDKVSGYFMLLQSHEYGKALQARYTPMIFPGGLSMYGYTKLSPYTMSHSRKWTDSRKSELHRMMGLATETTKNFCSDADKMIGRDISEADAVKYFVEVFDPDVWKRVQNGYVDNVPTKLSDLNEWEHSNRALKKIGTYMASIPSENVREGGLSVWTLLNTVLTAYELIVGLSDENRFKTNNIDTTGPGITAKGKAFILSRRLIGQ